MGIEDISGLGAALQKLIEVVGNGAGVVYEPHAIRRRARAEAEALVVRAEAEGRALEIHERARLRVERIAEIEQRNLDSIVEIAAQQLPNNVSADPTDKDWTKSFFRYAEDISSSEMQTIWGKILAGEIASPGSFSKRTIAAVYELDKDEARAFESLCSVLLRDRRGLGFLIKDDTTYRELAEMGIGQNTIAHFTAIGFLIPEELSFTQTSAHEWQFSYCGERFKFLGKRKEPGAYTEFQEWITWCRLSQVGDELSRIAGASRREAYIDHLADRFRTIGVSITRADE
jgi:uncharacterized repeat protein (TIGR03899 family)